MNNSKSMILDLTTNKVVVKRNVFHTRMENRICTEIGSTDVITVDCRGGWKRNAKFREKRTYPSELSCSISDSTVLSFRG